MKSSTHERRSSASEWNKLCSVLDIYVFRIDYFVLLKYLGKCCMNSFDISMNALQTFLKLFLYFRFP